MDTAISKELKCVVDRICTLTFTRQDYAYVKGLIDSPFVVFPMSNLEVHWHPVFSRAPYRAGIFTNTARQRFSILKDESALLCKMARVLPELKYTVKKGTYCTFMHVQQLMIVISDRTLRDVDPTIKKK